MKAIPRDSSSARAFDQAAQRTPEAVELPYRGSLKRAAVRIPHQLVKLWPAFFRAANYFPSQKR
jgi:hypothetical protein